MEAVIRLGHFHVSVRMSKNLTIFYACQEIPLGTLWSLVYLVYLRCLWAFSLKLLVSRIISALEWCITSVTLPGLSRHQEPRRILANSFFHSIPIQMPRSPDEILSSVWSNHSNNRPVMDGFNWFVLSLEDPAYRRAQHSSKPFQVWLKAWKPGTWNTAQLG